MMREIENDCKLNYFYISSTFPDPAKFICVCVCVCEWKTLLIQKRILRQFKFVSQSDRRKMPAGYFEEKKNARSCNPGTRLFTHQKKFFRGCRISPAAYQSYAVIGEHTRPARKETFFSNQSINVAFFFFILFTRFFSIALKQKKKIFFHFLLLSFLLDLTSCWLIFL